MDEAIALLERAALGQVGWRAPLEAIGEATGSMGGQLIGLGSAGMIPFNMMTGVAPETASDFEAAGGGDPRINSRVRVGSAAAELEICDEARFTTAADMRRNPEYADWIHRYDMHHACLTTLVKSPDSLVGLAVLRGRRHGHIEADQKRAFAELAVHVRAAVRTQIALQDQGMLLATGMMEAMGAAVFVCEPGGGVRAMTPAAEALVTAGDFLRLRSGVLTTAHEADHAALTAEIAAAVRRAPHARPLTAIRQLSGDDRLLVEACPLPVDHAPAFRASVLVVAHVASADEARLGEVARILYGLSAAEAAVAAQLALGRNPTVIAHDRRVAVGTVRSQIRRILEKSGSSSQLEFAARLHRY